ncbi:elongation factor P--(R)-beta-lysine ligase [Thalassotalea sp. PLHSN55]|uniref:elongation factor P--(R)-beta-lysine ligase n=1 Tax=Thalassotalea sp. PLHSN55 TaxID=3435888 RepID=UPI003F836A85
MTWSSTLSWRNAQQRAELLSSIRSYFDRNSVLEVETPLLSQGTVTDVYLDAFHTRYNFLANSDQKNSELFYLQTSPEFAMKRLLASGYQDIFQLCKAFRHEPAGSHHNPEFTILEWYRLGFDHFALMDDLDALLQDVLNCLPSTKLSYQEVFLKFLNIDPLDTSLASLLSVIKEQGILSDWLSKETDIDVLLQFIFAEVIEPQIGIEEPCFIYGFPRSQAALAKISTDDNRVADRFECYFRGIELANGFHELTCADEQKERFEQDNITRKSKGLAEREIDENFLAALNHGLPECSGVALGIDRLVMLALHEKSIKNVISFPIEHA